MVAGSSPSPGDGMDELILQVFEEHEDVFFWPVTSQKDAKTFVKFVHEKGAAYEEISREIDEFEHNFSAWRKGLGRVGIGTRMIDRINKTVESVIDSDDEDSLEFNLKQLAKVNKKNDSKAKQSKQSEATKKESPTSPTSPVAKDSKQQQNDIASSMSKNVDKNMEQQKQSLNNNEVKPASAAVAAEPIKSHETILRNGASHAINGEAKTKSASSSAHAQPSRDMAKPAATRDITDDKVVKKEPEVKKAEVVTEEKAAPVAAKRASLVQQQEKEVTSAAPEERSERSERKSSQDDPEVDDVKKKMEAIRKKVELMKKQKAEKLSAAPPPSEQTDGEATSRQQTASDNADKYEAMRKKIEQLRNKIKSDDDPQPAVEEQRPVPPKPKDLSVASKTPEAVASKTPEAVQSPPSTPTIVVTETEPAAEVKEVEENIPKMAMAEEAEVSSSEDDEEEESESEADEIYDSDLDPDNYDSDLEYDLHTSVSKLAALVHDEKTRQRERDGPGHVFIFSDSPADDRKHRVKVGASRSPEKKFRQAQSFNPSFKMVSCTAVSQRKAASKEIHTVLDTYKLHGYNGWFVGPVDKILQCVSTVTEKFGSGPALSSFQTDSQC